MTHYGYKKPNWLHDDLGMWKLRWVFAMVALVVCVIGTIIFFTAVTLDRASCNQSGQRLGVHAQYRILTGCYYTLKNGTVIPSDKYPPKYLHLQ